MLYYHYHKINLDLRGFWKILFLFVSIVLAEKILKIGSLQTQHLFIDNSITFGKNKTALYENIIRPL